MRKFLGLMLMTALVAVTLLALSAAPTLANHVKCGDTITADTKLDSDLIGCPGDGIVIGADGITLDLGGHTVDGSGSLNGQPCDAGILNGPPASSACSDPNDPGHDDVTVRNGVIREFAAGLVVQEASRNRVRGLRVTGSRYAAVIVGDSDDSSIERNVLKDNPGFAGAFNLFAISRLRMSGNVVSGHRSPGIETDGIRDSWIERNFFVGNGPAGFHLHGSRNNLVERNWVTGNDTGMEISDGASDNRILGNWVFGNTSVGIMTQEGTHRNRFERNIVFDNGRSSTIDSSGILILPDGDEQYVADNLVVGNYQGIVLAESGGGSLIERNWVSRSTADGVLLRDPVSWSRAADRVERNFVTRNGDDGIDVEGPGDIVASNTATRNGDLGIEAAPGVTDGGGNRAFGNGNPLQCLNVSCR